MTETSWETKLFRRRKRTARRPMGCSLDPGPAPEHPARRAFAGKWLNASGCPLPPKGLGSRCQKPVFWKALQAWLGSECGAELLEKYLRVEKMLAPNPRAHRRL